MLLKDATLQEQLKRDGYIVVPFLTPEEFKSLTTFYSAIHGNEEPPTFIEDIHMTTWCKEPSYKKEVATNLNKIFAAASERFFNNYRRLNNVFIIKKSGKATTFKVHQDWNVIDETKFESVNVWVPLHDVDENSGALWVLKGSHHINRKIRGAGYLFPDYGAFYPELEKKALSVGLKAGEAIIFYHSIIHGSPPNIKPGLRIAACFSVIPEEAPLAIYFQPKAGDPLHQYEPDDDFVYKYNYLRTEAAIIPPAEKPAKVLPPYNNTKVTIKELEPFLKQKKNFFSFWKK